jgi:TolB-like protein/DNA-binding winged helix-turn-helix (wHTH) protein
MESPTVSGRAVRFGVYEVDLHTGELRKGGLRLRLQDKPFQILSRLLEHPGQVVTREELRQALWPADTFVDFDNSVNAAINKLREALGDSADYPRYVETLPRRGYRFIGAVNGVNGSAGTEAATSGNKASKRLRWFGWVAATAAVAALVATLLALNVFRMRDHVLGGVETPRIQSLAVIPLTNLSGDPAQEYFSDSMTDALITELAQIGSLKVISRTSIIRYKKTDKSLPEIARELNVDGIIEGTVQRSGDRVRITAQLIQAPLDKHLWAASYERDVRDVFGLERDIAADVANQVQARLTTQNKVAPPGSSGPEQPRPINLKALEAYLQGNYHLHKADVGPPDKELRMAGEYFQQAIDVDANFALAYVGLAETHHNLFWPSGEDFAIMRGAAEKAVGLDPSSSEARTEVALTKWEDWDWSGAEKEYRMAITLNPNNAFAHDQLGDCLDAMGRLVEGWKEKEIAQQLDPNQDHLSGPLYRRGDYDRSIELLQKWLETRPEDGYAHYFLSWDYAQKGMYREWVEELGQGMALIGFPEVAPRLRRAFGTSGYTGAMRQWASELERMAANKKGYFPGVLAQAYASLGDKDRAFYWLEQGVDHHHLASADNVLQWAKVDPMLAPLRPDPRYKDLLRRMRLPP